MVHHYEACQSVGVSFVLLVVETLGGWSDDAIQTICKIGRLLGQRLGSPPAESTQHLFQRLCGGGMLASGSTDCQPNHHGLMELFD